MLCGGIIGYRALRLSGIERGGKLGLYGFGASALLAFQVARKTYAAASSLGAALRAFVGGGLDALRRRAETHFASRAPRDGVFARSWSIGTTALWIAVLLTAYVLVYVI